MLLPSVALSVLSFNAVPKHAENLKISLLKQAEQLLYYVEQDLERRRASKALEAARAVGPERLLEGRPARDRGRAGRGGARRRPVRLAPARGVVEDARRTAGRRSRGAPRCGPSARRSSGVAPRAAREEEDSVPLTTVSGEELGVVRFRFTCDYAHRRLVREFFEQDFVNPEGAWVIRVTEPDGEMLYENARSRNDERFEVERVMTAPSYEGVRLQLRYRDRSIEQEVRRLAVTKTALIGFIDLMLLAGLVLVWTNVRRELKLSRLKSDFVANVSHELKTPLALIRLFAETLELGRVPTEEKKQQYHRIINKESRRLTQLINNILDFSRIEAGRKEYRFVAHGRWRRWCATWSTPTASRSSTQGFALELDVAEDLPEMEIGPRGAVPGPHQPPQQRDQVQPGREEHRGLGAARGGPGAGVGRRPRHRHPEGGAEADLREVLPGGEQPGAHDQGQRARPRPRPAHHGGPRGARRGGERPRAREAPSPCRSRCGARPRRTSPVPRAGVPWGIARP